MDDHGQKVLEAALALSESERTRIAEALLASLGPQEEEITDAEFREELDRRLDDFLKGRDDGTDWEDLRDSM